MKLASVLGLCLTVLVALVAARVSAQTTSSDATLSTTTNSDGTTTSTPAVLNIVEITRLVPSGTTAVTAFTVPAGQTLIITDALVTNTGTAATCGAAINRAGGTAAAVTTPTATTATGTTTTPSTTGTTATTSGTVSAGVPTLAGTLTQTDSTITGPLCVAARTTTPLPLSTGIEFGPGQMVQLINAPDATTPTGTAATAGAVGFHLRGMLVAS